mmetsp:Transcript_131940/g.329080  ORF Transcript_131940/g.329080 Transcript_131940/m.329080 type:complete len:275 (-) Transcript_131940:124-948(-)
MGARCSASADTRQARIGRRPRWAPSPPSRSRRRGKRRASSQWRTGESSPSYRRCLTCHTRPATIGRVTAAARSTASMAPAAPSRAPLEIEWMCRKAIPSLRPTRTRTSPCGRGSASPALPSHESAPGNRLRTPLAWRRSFAKHAPSAHSPSTQVATSGGSCMELPCKPAMTSATSTSGLPSRALGRLGRARGKRRGLRCTALVSTSPRRSPKPMSTPGKPSTQSCCRMCTRCSWCGVSGAEPMSSQQTTSMRRASGGIFLTARTILCSGTVSCR